MYYVSVLISCLLPSFVQDVYYVSQLHPVAAIVMVFVSYRKVSRSCRQ